MMIIAMTMTTMTPEGRGMGDNDDNDRDDNDDYNEDVLGTWGEGDGGGRDGGWREVPESLNEELPEVWSEI